MNMELEDIFYMVDLAVKKGKHRVAIETLKDCLRQAQTQLIEQAKILNSLTEEQLAELKRKNSP